jgi:hypothetical protein
MHGVPITHLSFRPPVELGKLHCINVGLNEESGNQPGPWTVRRRQAGQGDLFSK